jgi:hypothetical protein
VVPVRVALGASPSTGESGRPKKSLYSVILPLGRVEMQLESMTGTSHLDGAGTGAEGKKDRFLQGERS